jgi:predicted RNA-binding Zn-ribbon protein involved in translation (DUF1610 family)
MLDKGKTRKFPPAFPCPKCSTEILIGQQACNNCGEQFEYRCAKCGMIAGSVSGFCTNCGGKLLQHTHPAKPPTRQAKILHRKGRRAEQQKEAQEPLSKIGVYLGLVAIILCILGALYFVGTGPQGEPSKWLGGGFIFQGKSPPSTPPSAEVNKKPVAAPDLPRYTANQVVLKAKNQSPDCRTPTRRVG